MLRDVAVNGIHRIIIPVAIAAISRIGMGSGGLDRDRLEIRTLKKGLGDVAERQHRQVQ